MSVSRSRGTNLHLTIAVLTAVAILLFPAVFAVSQTPSLAASSTTVAAGLSFSSPTSVLVDAADAIYIADTLNNCVRRVDPTGTTSVLVGTAGIVAGADVCSTQPPATPAAGLAHPLGLAFDSLRRLYIADSLHGCIRMLAPGSTGVRALRTVAGTCTGSSVLASPSALAIDSADTLYIAAGDPAGTTPSQVLRQGLRAPAASLCVLAGASTPSASLSAPACASAPTVALAYPAALAISPLGDLVIADTGNNCLRQITAPASSTPAAATVVGICGNDGSGSGVVLLHAPTGLAVSHTGLLLVAEAASNLVTELRLGDMLALPIAGGTPASASAEQAGAPALSVALLAPQGLAIDAEDRLLVADTGNNLVRRISRNQLFPPTPLPSPAQPAATAGSPVLPVTFSRSPSAPLSLTATGDFTILSDTCSSTSGPVCQAIVRFTPTHPGLRGGGLQATDTLSGATATVALSGLGLGPLPVFLPGAASTRGALPGASTMALAADGSVLVTELLGDSFRLHRLANGADQLVSDAVFLSPTAIVASPAGDIFVADSSRGTVTHIAADGTANDRFLTGLDTPRALALDPFGNLFVAEAGSTHTVSRILAGSSVREVLAGNGSMALANGVPATSAALLAPTALTLASNGVLYIADAEAHAVFSIQASGTIRLVAGGPASPSRLAAPSALTTDAAGNLYIGDRAANAIVILYPYAGLQNNLELAFGPADATLPLPLSDPASLAVTAAGDLLVLDAGTGTLRQVTRSAGALSFPASATLLSQRLLNAGTAPALLASTSLPSDPHFTIAETTCPGSLASGSLCALSIASAPAATAIQASLPLTTDGTVALQLQSAGTLPATQTPAQFPTPAQIPTPTQTPTQTLTAQLPTATAISGQPFVLQAILTGSTAGPIPTGSFTFLADGRALCSTATTSADGAVVCTAGPSSLPPGSYSATFLYSGDRTYAPLAADLLLTVSAGRTVATPAGTFTLTVATAPDLLPGSTATLPVTVSSVGGFSGPVALRCGGLPAGATCSFARGELTVAAGASVSTTMTVILRPAASAMVGIPAAPPAANALPLAAAAVFPVELTGLGACFAGAIRRRRGSRLLAQRLSLVVLFGIALAGLTGCGVTSASPVQTVTVNISASSVAAPSNLQTAAITLDMTPER